MVTMSTEVVYDNTNVVITGVGGYPDMYIFCGNRLVKCCRIINYPDIVANVRPT